MLAAGQKLERSAMPAYFHYLEENGELNQVIDRFANGAPFTQADRRILRRMANERDPADDRPRRLARALLKLDRDTETTSDFPITQHFRRLKARVLGLPIPSRDDFPFEWDP